MTLAAQAAACFASDPGATAKTRHPGLCQVASPCEASAQLSADGVCHVTYAADGTACDDPANPCLTGGHCRAGTCAGSAKAADGTACDDGNPCTQDTRCRGGSCVGSNLADNSPCDDQSVCTNATVCLAGVCQGGQALACPAKAACHVDGACDPKSGCIDVAMDGPCIPDLKALTLDGCCSADYSAPFQVGAQVFHLIVDSGSTMTAIASKACQKGCDDLDPLYTPSTKAVGPGQETGSQYGDLSGWDGVVYRDQAALPGIGDPFAFGFAAMTVASADNDPRGSTAFFVPNLCTGVARENTRQGILGLGNHQLAATKGIDTLLDVLSSAGHQDAFATQFCNTAGRLWFGGFDPAYLAGAPVYTPMTTSDGFYRIQVNDVLVGGRSLGLSASLFGGLPVVDNGTSVMHFPQLVVDAVVQALAADSAFAAQFSAADLFTADGACGPPADRTLTRSQLDAQLPSFSLILPAQDGAREVHVTMPATASYLTFANSARGDMYCATLLSNGADGSTAAGQTNPSIIGNAAMRAHVTIFDRQNGLLGFAPQRNCIGADL